MNPIELKVKELKERRKLYACFNSLRQQRIVRGREVAENVLCCTMPVPTTQHDPACGADDETVKHFLT
jgi:hypothetical protein